jgi:hypothetical protein
MKTASWVILAILGALVVLVSGISTWFAYSGSEYPIGTIPITTIAAAHDGAGPALRAIRATSAAYGLGYGVLFLAIVLGPYRRGEVWAWWALLGAVAAIAVVSVLRVPALGVTLGVQPPLIQLGVALVGLLLDVGRLRSPR